MTGPNTQVPLQLLPVQVAATVVCVCVCVCVCVVCSVIVFINQSSNFMLLFWSVWEVFWSNEYLNTDKMKLPFSKQYNPCLMYGRAQVRHSSDHVTPALPQYYMALCELDRESLSGGPPLAGGFGHH